MIIQDHIFCANIGDSRAIVCSQTKEEAWKAKPISIDHKADLPSEAERIIKNRGRLEPYRD
jgi:serine/threonine protein phosphatase PrpC